jgi:16S rRNA (cytosine1402-N4)-methyltransferase
VSAPEERHIPVLAQEVVQLLAPQRGGVFVDGTLGMGGHAELVLDAGAQAGKPVRLIGFDQDAEALGFAKQRLGERAEYVHANFASLAEELTGLGVSQVDGILMDLGVSSYQIDTPERGFSFLSDGPLDMRMDPEAIGTAAALVNGLSEFHLANLIYEYGEERLSRRIARAIVQERKGDPIKTTRRLGELLYQQYPAKLRHVHPHPATRTFQALRIAVNDELGVLERGLAAALELLAPGGILAVISFHSLEDRIVKHRFREAVADGGFELLTKKPIEAGEEEREVNSRSRSAKLRGIRKIA